MNVLLRRQAFYPQNLINSIASPLPIYLAQYRQMFLDQEFYVDETDKQGLQRYDWYRGVEYNKINSRETDLQEFNQLTSLKGFGTTKYSVKLTIVRKDGFRSNEIPRILIVSIRGIAFKKENDKNPNLVYPSETIGSIGVRGMFLMINFQKETREALYIVSSRSYEFTCFETFF